MSARKVRPAKSSCSVFLSGAAPVDNILLEAHKFQHQFTSRFLHSIWPICFEPPTALVTMNQVETAVWVRMLAVLKGWKECDRYSEIFKTHWISGWMLIDMSVQSLKNELKIDSLGHRIEIVTAIKNNELTLRNPTIVSCFPEVFFIRAETEPSHNGSDGDVLFGEKWHKDYEHEGQVSKWFSNGKDKASIATRNEIAVSASSAKVERWRKDYEHELEVTKWFSNRNHKQSLSTRNWDAVSASCTDAGTSMYDSLLTSMNEDDIILSKSVNLPAIASDVLLFSSPLIELESSSEDCAELARKVDLGRWFEEYPSLKFSGINAKTRSTCFRESSPLDCW